MADTKVGSAELNDSQSKPTHRLLVDPEPPLRGWGVQEVGDLAVLADVGVCRLHQSHLRPNPHVLGDREVRRASHEHRVVVVLVQHLQGGKSRS